MIMELMNELYAQEPDLSGGALAEVLENLTLLLAPFAPYLAQELWEEQGRSTPVFRESWPQYDPELAKEDLAEVVVQVNGKLRGRVACAVRDAGRRAGGEGAGGRKDPAVPGRQADREGDRGAG